MKNDNKKIVGYWYSEYDPQYPRPESSTDPEWINGNTIKKFGDKLVLVQSLIKDNKIGGDYVQYRGMSPCRMCKKWNGSGEYEYGEFMWPSGYIHYILEHNIKPPQEFIDMINGIEVPKMKLKLKR